MKMIGKYSITKLMKIEKTATFSLTQTFHGNTHSYIKYLAVVPICDIGKKNRKSQPVSAK